jgi:hypothetical protein
MNHNCYKDCDDEDCDDDDIIVPLPLRYPVHSYVLRYKPGRKRPILLKTTEWRPYG